MTMPISTTGAKMKIGVIGMPFSKGQPKAGTQLAPKLIRQAGMLEKMREAGNDVIDHGDLAVVDIASDEPIKNVSRPKNVGAANKLLCENVEKVVRQKQGCLVLGGDHSIAMGSIQGHIQAEPDLVVLWVDAHADINTPLTSPSGNVHGMPLSFIVKELEPYMPTIPGFEWAKPCLAAKDIAYIGLRDVDGGEKAIIDKLGIHSFSMHEVDKFGVAAVVERALNAMDPSGIRPIHVSFDVDAMDPDIIPSTGTAVPGGLSLREAYYIAEEVAATGRLSVLDCVEVNALLGSKEEQQRTVKNTVEVMSRFYGSKRCGNIPRGYTLPEP
ncbi:arginase-1-like [Haliotis rufescens]|uniref:arginase-1-like n=1 Tax=Haliotis rufescens TaxID=6454 RepID=UPI00201ED40C|nr:arginase-1-like [Haliotis rufescens]